MAPSLASTPSRSCWLDNGPIHTSKLSLARGGASRNPVMDVDRPALNRDEGSTAAFSKAQARKLLEAPPADTLAGLRDRAILSVGLQVGFRRAEIAALARLIAETDAQEFASQYPAYAADIAGETRKALDALRTDPLHQRRYADFVAAMVYGEKAGIWRALATVVGLAEAAWQP